MTDTTPSHDGNQTTKGSAGEVFAAFLKLGLTSFGGPIAHLGYFRDELVLRRKWIDERGYADLVALSQFLPGPASSQVGFALGLLRGGPLGALAAWAAFTLPSAILLILFAYGAAAFGGRVGGGIITGLKIVAVAIVAQAVWGMAKNLCPDRERATIVSPLRQRLIDDMNMRRLSRETQRNYFRDIGRLATFLGRSPGTATSDDLRRFQIEQQEDGVPVPTMNSIVSALRFFFTHTVDRPDLARKLVRLAHPRTLPVVLSRNEVARLLNATTCLKHQAALSVAYGAGLRVAEVSMLKVADIDSERMLLRVERGKGGRYRNAMLSQDLLLLLRQWWRVGCQQGVMHRDGWLFPGQHAMKPISTRRGGPGRRHRQAGWTLRDRRHDLELGEAQVSCMVGPVGHRLVTPTIQAPLRSVA
jgi:chromate transport protein ChrA/site-specific recombinase XerC